MIIQQEHAESTPRTQPTAATSARAIPTRNYTKFPNELFGRTDVDGAMIFVYALLLHYASMGDVFLGHARIAAETNMSVSSAGRALQRLRDVGLVKWEQRTGTSNVYYPLPVPVASQVPEVAPEPEGVGQFDGGGSVNLTEGGRSNRPTNKTEMNKTEMSKTPPTPSPTEAPAVTLDLEARRLTPTESTTPTPGLESEFAQWYAAYPRKVGRKRALDAYKAARKTVDAATLLEAIEMQAPSLIARGSRYCPHPSTWLNGQRWEDDLTEIAPPASTRPNRVQENMAVARAMWEAEQAQRAPVEILEIEAAPVDPFALSASEPRSFAGRPYAPTPPPF